MTQFVVTFAAQTLLTAANSNIIIQPMPKAAAKHLNWPVVCAKRVYKSDE